VQKLLERVGHLHRVGAAILRALSFVTMPQAKQSLLGSRCLALSRVMFFRRSAIFRHHLAGLL